MLAALESLCTVKLKRQWFAAIGVFHDCSTKLLPTTGKKKKVVQQILFFHGVILSIQFDRRLSLTTLLRSMLQLTQINLLPFYQTYLITSPGWHDLSGWKSVLKQVCLCLGGLLNSKGQSATSRVTPTRVLDGLHGFFSLKKKKRGNQQRVCFDPLVRRSGGTEGEVEGKLWAWGPQCGWEAPRGG